ncbi:MAG: hypothetical protein M9955_15520 [Rhizobiaceae bacterium]|nr:hypothetical protein [Rhizobiaceae bacterium]
MDTAMLRDVLGDRVFDDFDAATDTEDEFDAAIGAAMAENRDEVATAIERHLDAVLTAERNIAVLRRKGSAAIAAIDERCERATAAYQATMERFARDRARAVEDMRRSIATAEKLAAISRAALQAVQP